MKRAVFIGIFLVLTGFVLPLAAAEITLGGHVNNYSGKISGMAQFQLTQEAGSGFSFELYLKHDQFVKQLFGGNVLYTTPGFGGCKAYIGMGPVFRFSLEQIYPGGKLYAGFYTPWKVSFHVSSTGISSPENLFSAFDYSADAALQGDLSYGYFTLKYLFNKLEADNDVYRTHSAEITTAGYSLEKALKIQVKIGAEMLFPESENKMKDLAVYGQIGCSYRTKKAGSYGIYADLKQYLSEGKPMQFGITLEYGFVL